MKSKAGRCTPSRKAVFKILIIKVQMFAENTNVGSYKDREIENEFGGVNTILEN